MNQIVNGMYHLLEYPFSLTEMDWQQTESLDTNVNSAPTDLTGMGVSQIIWGAAAFIFAAYATTKVVLPCLQRVTSYWVNRGEFPTINQDQNVEFWEAFNSFAEARMSSKKADLALQSTNSRAYEAWNKIKAVLYANPRLAINIEKDVVYERYFRLKKIAELDIWRENPEGAEKLTGILEIYEKVIFDSKAFLESLGTNAMTFMQDRKEDATEVHEIIATMTTKNPSAFIDIQSRNKITTILEISETILADNSVDLEVIRENLKVLENDPDATQCFIHCERDWRVLLNEMEFLMHYHEDAFDRYLGEFRTQHPEYEWNSVEFVESFIDFLMSSRPF